MELIGRVIRFYRSKIHSVPIRPLDEVIFSLTLYLAIVVTGLSVGINFLLSMGLAVHIINIITLVFTLFILYLSKVKRRLQLSKILFFAMTYTAIVLLWLNLEGSSGPTIIIVNAIIPLLVLLVKASFSI